MPKSKKEVKLQADSLKASRIEQTMATTGWKDIQAIIQDKYDSLMNELLAKENPEARGGINAITEIMDDISRELKFGESARKKYAERYLKQKEETNAGV